MPHIDVKCFPGRTEQQKKECAEQIANAVAVTLGCKLSSVSVAISDVEQEAWKTEVWDKQIVPNEDKLYKKPEYTC